MSYGNQAELTTKPKEVLLVKQGLDDIIGERSKFLLVGLNALVVLQGIEMPTFIVGHPGVAILVGDGKQRIVVALGRCDDVNHSVFDNHRGHSLTIGYQFEVGLVLAPVPYLSVDILNPQAVVIVEMDICGFLYIGNKSALAICIKHHLVQLTTIEPVRSTHHGDSTLLRQLTRSAIFWNTVNTQAGSCQQTIACLIQL